MGKQIRVVILEDRAPDAELMERELRGEGIAFTSKRVVSREGFINQLQESNPDLVLADYTLPSFDGLTALAIARERQPDVLFIFVTGTMGEELAVEAIKLGATDFVLKTHLTRLGPAVRRALREAEERAARKKAEEYLRATHGRLREVLKGVVQTVAKTVEMRDPYTAGHQRRVAQLATAIGAELHFAEERLSGLHTAAFIHDIGKVAVPAEILVKPTKLNEAEFAMIKAHCQVGSEILGDIQFPWPIARFILQHHEKLDGSGYPEGIKGDAILLEARMICVADVVEAMASHRPYRSALGIEKAIQEIVSNRGKLYDPVVAAACVKLFMEKGFQLEASPT